MEADLPISYGDQNRYIEIRVADESKGLIESYRVPVAIKESPLFENVGNPTTLHSYADTQPGLAIAVTSANTPNGCARAFNGHTSSYDYIITAGHCLNNGPSTVNN